MDAEFWDMVDYGPAHKCWEWKGFRDSGGYGRCNRKRYPTQSAHRVAWKDANPNEPWPEVVMHTCDNPACCNPSHLIAGIADNNADRSKPQSERRPVSDTATRETEDYADGFDHGFLGFPLGGYGAKDTAAFLSGWRNGRHVRKALVGDKEKKEDDK